MIRKMLITAASLALMATSAVAQSNSDPDVVQQPAEHWKTMSSAEQDKMRADAYKVGIAYNYCGDYIAFDRKTAEFTIWIIAQAEGLTLRQAGRKMDDVAEQVWRGIPVPNEPAACANAMRATNAWHAVANQ